MYGEKEPLVKIRENALFRHRPEARQVRRSSRPYLYEWKYIFWILRAQIIRICNVEMKIWGCTPSSGAFSKWLSRKKCWMTKNRNFHISTSNYHRYTQFNSRYMFLRMTNSVILVKNSLRVKKTSKSTMAANFGQKIVLGMKSIMPVSTLPSSCQNKKIENLMCIYS